MVEKLQEALAIGVKAPLFLDIGSNVGFFSLSAAAAGFDVIAFDAMSQNADRK